MSRVVVVISAVNPINKAELIEKAFREMRASEKKFDWAKPSKRREIKKCVRMMRYMSSQLDNALNAQDEESIRYIAKDMMGTLQFMLDESLVNDYTPQDHES